MAINPYFRRKMRVNQLGYKELAGVATNEGTVRISIADGVAMLWDTGQDFSSFAIPSGATGKGARRYKVYIYEGADVLCGYIDIEGAGETLGSELAVNGTFAADTDWTKGTSWTIGTGKATHATGTASDLVAAANISFTKGKLYKMTVKIACTTAGTLIIKMGSITVATEVFAATASEATFTYYWTEATGACKPTFSADATWAGTLADVVIKEVTDVPANQGVKLFAAQCGGSQNIEGTISILPTNFSLANAQAKTYKVIPCF